MAFSNSSHTCGYSSRLNIIRRNIRKLDRVLIVSMTLKAKEF
ncbi:hypothetical protein BH23THE1_BH23THE1_22970 [soil metagenome]